MAAQPQPVEPDAPEANATLRLLQAGWRRKTLVLLGLALGLAGGTAYYFAGPPTYQSTAQVLVVKKRTDSVTGVDTRQLAIEDYVSTHQVLLKSPLVVGRAIKKHGLDSLPTLRGEKGDLTEAVTKRLTVTRSRGTTAVNTNVLDVACTGRTAEDSAQILAAVVESYQEFLDETYRTMSDDTLDLVAKARDLLRKELADKEAEYRAFRLEAPLVAVGTEGDRLGQDRLLGIEAKRSALLVRRAELRARLTSVEEGRKQGVDRDTLTAMIADFSNGPGADGQRPAGSAAQEQLVALLGEEQKLLETHGPNSAQVKSVRERIRIARAAYALPSAPWRDGGETGKEGDPVEAYVSYLKQQVAHVDTAERLLSEVYEQEHAKVRALAGDAIRDEAYRTDIARAQQLYDGVVKRLQDVGLVRDVGGYDAQTIAPPGPGKQVAPSGLVAFPAGALAGLLLGAALAGLAELADRGFRTPDDVRRRLGLPVVGCVPGPAGTLPRAAGNGHAGPAPLAALHRPESPEAEAYRGVRTALFFSTRGEGPRVIQVTSPNPGDGKSTLAANLAVSVARAGRRVLLIDADFRGPSLHRAFGVSGDVGLSTVLAGRAEPPDAVRESGVAGLRVLPCGPVPPDPADLLTSPRFRELLDLLRGQYDFVLVDTPPLLTATDASVVAPRADGVLLAVRLARNGRPAAERAREVLAAVGARVVGVVVGDAGRRARPRPAPVTVAAGEGVNGEADA